MFQIEASNIVQRLHLILSDDSLEVGSGVMRQPYSPSTPVTGWRKTTAVGLRAAALRAGEAAAGRARAAAKEGTARSAVVCAYARGRIGYKPSESRSEPRQICLVALSCRCSRDSDLPPALQGVTTQGQDDDSK